MADNYLTYSFAIPTTPSDAPQDLVDAVHAEIDRLQDAYDHLEGVDENGVQYTRLDEPPIDSPIFGEAEVFCAPEHFQVDPGGEIWISGSDVDVAIAITQWVLQQRRGLTDPVVIQWAETCSKPRVDEFGGGVAVVTSGDCEYAHTSDMGLRLSREMVNRAETDR